MGTAAMRKEDTVSGDERRAVGEMAPPSLVTVGMGSEF